MTKPGDTPAPVGKAANAKEEKLQYASHVLTELGITGAEVDAYIKIQARRRRMQEAITGVWKALDTED